MRTCSEDDNVVVPLAGLFFSTTEVTVHRRSTNLWGIAHCLMPVGRVLGGVPRYRLRARVVRWALSKRRGRRDVEVAVISQSWASL